MTEAGSEASVAERPQFEEVGGGEATPEAASGACKAPLEEEKEKENRDTHFKLKRKKPESKERS